MNESRDESRSPAGEARVHTTARLAASGPAGGSAVAGSVGSASAGSQTLSRGIRVLEVVARAGKALSIDEIAGLLGVHRSIAYRLLRTLEEHALIVRDDAGRVELGAGLAALAAGISRDLQTAALPELDAVANELGMTCLLAVLLDGEEAVTLVSASPRRNMAVVSYRPGHRHPLVRGAPGKAILAEMEPEAWPAALDEDLRAELTLARRRGYAASYNEVVPSTKAIAVPLTLPGQPPASIAVIHVSLPQPEQQIGARLRHAAETIAREMGSAPKAQVT